MANICHMYQSPPPSLPPLQLAKQGYAYYGSEPLYSGVSGTVMHADIFIGVVYYQRLRHMVRMDDHSVALS